MYVRKLCREKEVRVSSGRVVVVMTEDGPGRVKLDPTGAVFLETSARAEVRPLPLQL